jgi:hypothetical protein
MKSCAIFCKATTAFGAHPYIGHQIANQHFYGRGAGVGRTREVGVALGVAVAVGVGVGVGELD